MLAGFAPDPADPVASGDGILRLALQGDPLELRRLAAAVDGFAQHHGLPPDVAVKLNLALDELVTNVIRYGAPPGRPAPEVEVSLELAGDRVVAEIRDAGRPFNPLQVPEPDVDAPLEARPIGGLGVHLARQLMDVIRYRRVDGRNCLTLVKLLDGAALPGALP